MSQADFVVVANRLPVDRDDDGGWRRSPGGLVTALEPVMRKTEGAWVGWAGKPGLELEPFDFEGTHLVPITLSADEVQNYYEGFSNDTIWPLYHDVIAAPRYRRVWWDAYVDVNRRFAEASATAAAEGATVWVQDYQLQLVPAMLRRMRPDLTIGYFHHIPFPAYGLFSQLPWRRQVIEGLLGADVVGFQRVADAGNFARAVRRQFHYTTKASGITVPLEDGSTRNVLAKAYPISIDAESYIELAQRPDIQARAKEIRESLGNPKTVMLGVDRLDYTKGIYARLRAFAELMGEGHIDVEDAVFIQVAVPSREQVEQYRILRDEIERLIGRINGDHGRIGRPAVHYLHSSYPREEMAAMYRAADVMVVTPYRDGMNLVAKEYVACRYEDDGALVLSEFAGAADELRQAWLVNPYDINGMKSALLEAYQADDKEVTRRMKAMRKQVTQHDVKAWAASFMTELSDVGGGHAKDVRAPGGE